MQYPVTKVRCIAPVSFRNSNPAAWKSSRRAGLSFRHWEKTMTYTLTEAGYSDQLAVAVINDRKSRNNTTSRRCWAATEIMGSAKRVVEISVTPFDGSATGEWKSNHAELRALQKLYEEYCTGQKYIFTGPGCGTTLAKEFNKYITTRPYSIVLYTELPPCTDCRRYLGTLCAGVTVVHRYMDTFEGYFTAGERAKENMWRKYFSDIYNTPFKPATEWEIKD
jgi:hypothetical protein